LLPDCPETDQGANGEVRRRRIAYYEWMFMPCWWSKCRA
jgi:hypothetical protein